MTISPFLFDNLIFLKLGNIKSNTGAYNFSPPYKNFVLEILNHLPKANRCGY